jgi:chromosome segregation ATPase
MSRIYGEREKAKAEVNDYLEKMRISIIKMRLSYTDIARLKQKIDNFANWERKYAKFFRPPDGETEELKKHIAALEEELKSEREEKFRIISESQEKAQEFNESMQNMKNNLKHLMLEKAKRQHRLKALEQKISGKIDVHGYYDS